MKKYLLLLPLLFSLSVFGQARYKLELTNLSFEIRDPVKNNTTSHVKIDVIYEDNSTAEVYFRDINEEEDDEWNWNLNPPIISDKRPIGVHVSGFVNFRTGTDAEYDEQHSVVLCPVNSYSINSQSPRMSGITFNVKVSPVLDGALAQPIDNAFPTGDSIDIISNYKGFPASVYNWEFSWDLTNWHPLPVQYQGLDSIRLTAAQMLAGSGYNANDSIQRNIRVRLSTCSGNVVSNPVTYTIVKSLPGITNITIIPPRCFDTDDGRVKFTFDRALISGESLLMNLRDSTHPGLLYFRQIINDSLDASHTYTFPDNLQPAQYYLVYQGRYIFIDGSGATQTSQSNIKQSSLFVVAAPAAVAFTTAKIDIWCYGGNDGTITVNATGGIGSYQYMIKRSGQPDSLWYSFSAAGQHTITGLTANDYVVQVRDGNLCYAKTGPGGTIISTPVNIIQPATPLQNNLIALINPTGFGLSDGSIEVEITGGTSKPDGSYNFQWTTFAGAPLSTGITTNVTGTGYRIKLSGLPDGTCILSTNDYNNSSATSHAGCTDADTFTIKQPQLLEVWMEIRDSIACRGDANGSLAAHGKGGVPFTSGNPYTYTWKKRNAGNVYVVLPAQADSIATGLNTGWYAVNIQDANGIVLAQDSIFFLPEPTLLQVSASHTNVTCAGLPDGSATAAASGGTPPYRYQWSTGETTPGISHLTAGTYLVFIKDNHNCEAQQNVVVVQPNAMTLTVTRQEPLCNSYCDGKLTANLTGGTAPFTYLWSGSGSTNNVAANLCSGNYQIAITDANGCGIIHGDTLTDPVPLPIALGPDRYICTNQSILYSIAIPNAADISYLWSSSNGFASTQPGVALTQAGTYIAGVTDLNSCNNKDTLVLTAVNTIISNEFALPTQAFVNEQIVVVNTSNPSADSVRWIFPAQAVSILQTANFAAFSIADTGAYYLRFITYRGLCYAEQVKKVIVSQRTGLNSIGTVRNPFIKIFTVAPNPSTGSFTVRVTLESAATIQLKLINILTNQIINLSNQSGSDSYVLPVNTSVVAGTYVLLLETPKGSATMKVVIL